METELLNGAQLDLLTASPMVEQAHPVESYYYDGRARLVRQVTTRSGRIVESAIPYKTHPNNGNWADLYDHAWLRLDAKPQINEESDRPVRVVDLFSGCGGLSIGIEEASRAVGRVVEHVMAADINSIALDVYASNFQPAIAESGPLQDAVREVGAPLSSAERALRSKLGSIDILAGGPPCQGHSDLNNHTRRQDPRNALFETMIRFVEIIRPQSVIIENVPGIINDKKAVTTRGRLALEALGYSVHETVLLASQFGVPQRRKRYFMVATMHQNFGFEKIASIASTRSVRWACEDLADIQSNSILDSHAATSAVNRKRAEYLISNNIYDLPDELRPPCHRDKPHSYSAVYGRLRWEEPAPTITSGFNSPGQGRFIHPAYARTLTPHEAARIQFFPDFFNWGASSREALTQMIGNAVPPRLAYAVALELVR